MQRQGLAGFASKIEARQAGSTRQTKQNESGTKAGTLTWSETKALPDELSVQRRNAQRVVMIHGCSSAWWSHGCQGQYKALPSMEDA